MEISSQYSRRLLVYNRWINYKLIRAKLPSGGDDIFCNINLLCTFVCSLIGEGRLYSSMNSPDEKLTILIDFLKRKKIIQATEITATALIEHIPHFCEQFIRDLIEYFVINRVQYNSLTGDNALVLWCQDILFNFKFCLIHEIKNMSKGSNLCALVKALFPEIIINFDTLEKRTDDENILLAFKYINEKLYITSFLEVEDLHDNNLLSLYIASIFLESFERWKHLILKLYNFPTIAEEIPKGFKSESFRLSRSDLILSGKNKPNSLESLTLSATGSSLMASYSGNPQQTFSVRDKPKPLPFLSRSLKKDISELRSKSVASIPIIKETITENTLTIDTTSILLSNQLDILEDKIIAAQTIVLHQTDIISLYQEYKHFKSLEPDKLQVSFNIPDNSDSKFRYDQVIKYWHIVLEMFSKKLFIAPMKPILIPVVSITRGEILPPPASYEYSFISECSNLHSPIIMDLSTSKEENKDGFGSSKELSVRLTDSKLERGPKEKKILIFQLLVTVKGETWTVFKRGDQVLDLYQNLNNEYRSADDGGIVPTIPPRVIIQISSNSLKNSKYVSTWFNKTLENVVLSRSSHFLLFIQQDQITYSPNSAHEGYLCKLSVGIDGGDSIYWKKAKWNVMKNGVILKYKIKGDKHPQGDKLTLSSPGGLVETEYELDIIKHAHFDAKEGMFPFILKIYDKKGKEKSIIIAALSESARLSWISASIDQCMYVKEKASSS